MFQITEVSPSYNATLVPINGTRVTITFSEDVNPATVSDLSVTLGVYESSPFDQVTGHVSFVDNNIIEFVVDGDLDYETKYIVIVTGDTFGIKSITGRALAGDYISVFSTETVPSGTGDTAEQPVDSIPLDSLEQSDILPVRWNAEKGVLTLYYEEALPSGTSVYITSKHPLGLPVDTDYWDLNKTITINETDIVIESSGNLDLTMAPRLAIKDQALFMPTTIPVISYITTSQLECVFDFAVNHFYTITVVIPDHGQHAIEFLGYPAPMFLTTDEARFHLKSLAGLYDTPDQLALTIQAESERAMGLWGANFPATIPYYVKEYVINRMKLSALHAYELRTASGGGTANSIALGDLKIGMSDTTSSTSKTDTSAMIGKFNEMDYVLSKKVRKHDLGTVPIYIPTYALMAEEHNSGVIASVPSRGRMDPTYDPTYDRSLRGRTVPRTNTGYHPELG